MTDDPTDYDRLMKANVERVFSERDPDRRRQVIADIYAPGAVLYEPGHVAEGHAGIDAAVQALLDNLPPDFVFSVEGQVVGHHGVGRLRWRAGPPGGPVAVTGTDVARFEAGLIQTLHVFLDPPVQGNA